MDIPTFKLALSSWDQSYPNSDTGTCAKCGAPITKSTFCCLRAVCRAQYDDAAAHHHIPDSNDFIPKCLNCICEHQFAHIMRAPCEKKKDPSHRRRVAIPKPVRIKVWELNIGNQIRGLCACCNSEQITVNNFECGHIISVANGGATDIDNLRPICSSCNKSMGTVNMNEFQDRIARATHEPLSNCAPSSSSPVKKEKKDTNKMVQVALDESLKTFSQMFSVQ